MASGGKKSSLLVIIIVVVLGLLLAGGISYFIATKIVADKTGEKKVEREPGVFMKLGDAKEGLIVNVGGGNSGRYLKTSIILEMKPKKTSVVADPKKAAELSPDDVKILDTVIELLRTQKMEDFDPSKQRKLKELIKDEINKALGEERVYDVYITNFVLQ